MGTGTASITVPEWHCPTQEELTAGHKTAVSAQIPDLLLEYVKRIAAVRGVSANDIIVELLANGVCATLEDPMFRRQAERRAEDAQQPPNTPQRRVVLGAEAQQPPSAHAWPAAQHSDHSGIEDTY